MNPPRIIKTVATATTTTTTSTSNPKRRRLIAITLSGGVDSSVVAYLMKQKYMQHASRHNHHELLAIHMSNWETLDEDDPFCTKDQDWKDAKAVASHLDLNIHPTPIKFVSEYWTQVFEPFVDGIQQGIRGNPDVDCNRYIKFGSLKEYIENKWGAGGAGNDVWLATGHYARLWERNNNNNNHNDMTNSNENADDLIEEMLEGDTSLDWIRNWGSDTTTGATTLCPLLLSARDQSKCQSLFLSSVPGTAFHNVLFPLGDLLKNKTRILRQQSSDDESCNTNNNHDDDGDCKMMTVREIAKHANLPTAQKRDSMGICFIGKRPGGFPGFIDQYFATENNQQYQFRDVDTKQQVIVGMGEQQQHHRISIYTRGQGAKIGGAKQPWFVTEVDQATQTIWLCAGTHHPALYANVFYIQELNWIAQDLPSPLKMAALSTTISMTATTTTLSPPTLQAKCRIRNLQPLVNCEITFDATTKLYRILTHKPLRAITPGQHCAFYVGQEGLVCLGGGTILKSGPTLHELGQQTPLDVQRLHPSGHNDLSIASAKARSAARTSNCLIDPRP